MSKSKINYLALPETAMAMAGQGAPQPAALPAGAAAPPPTTASSQLPPPPPLPAGGAAAAAVMAAGAGSMQLPPPPPLPLANQPHSLPQDYDLQSRVAQASAIAARLASQPGHAHVPSSQSDMRPPLPPPPASVTHPPAARLSADPKAMAASFLSGLFGAGEGGDEGDATALPPPPLLPLLAPPHQMLPPPSAPSQLTGMAGHAPAFEGAQQSLPPPASQQDLQQQEQQQLQQASEAAMEDDLDLAFNPPIDIFKAIFEAEDDGEEEEEEGRDEQGSGVEVGDGDGWALPAQPGAEGPGLETQPLQQPQASTTQQQQGGYQGPYGQQGPVGSNTVRQTGLASALLRAQEMAAGKAEEARKAREEEAASAAQQAGTGAGTGAVGAGGQGAQVDPEVAARIRAALSLYNKEKKKEKKKKKDKKDKKVGPGGWCRLVVCR